MTKIENDAHRDTQRNEYENLRNEFEEYKAQQFDERKRLMTEYQARIF